MARIKKMAKRVVAMLTMMVMLIGNMSLNVFAETGESSAETTQTIQDESEIVATNSLARILNSALESTQGDDSAICNMTKVTMNGAVATVELNAPTDSEVVVGIFEEESNLLLFSGSANVTEGTTTVDVTIGAEQLPDYYIIRVFLLGENQQALCKPMTCMEYTAAYQEYLAKSTSDFEENRVIILDDGAGEDFAVVKEESVVVEEGSYNTLVSVDDENGIYVFENIDDEIRNLAVGDIFYYNSADNIITIKVGDISIDDDTATITEAEAEISDVFEFVRIDESNTACDADDLDIKWGEIVEQENTAESQIYVLRSLSVPDIDINAKPTISIGCNIKYEPEDDGFKVTGGFKVDLSVYFKLYYDLKLFGTDYIDSQFILTTTSELSVKLEGKVSLFDDVTLFEVPIPIGATGFVLNVKASPIVEFGGGSIEYSVKSEQKSGYSYNSFSGLEKIRENDTTSEFDAKAEISVKLGIRFGIELEFVKIVKVSASLSVGIKDTSTLETTSFTDGDDVKHDCGMCLDGEMVPFGEFNISLKIGITDELSVTPISFTISVEVKKIPYYFSIDNLEFGTDECPHKSYKVTFNATRASNGSTISGVKIGDVTTDANGQAYAYYPAGKYAVTAIANGYYNCDKSFNIVDDAKQVDFVMRSNGALASVTTTTSSGRIKVTGYSDGLYVVSGIGELTQGLVPNDARKVIVMDGVSSIGNKAFFGCALLSEIELPNGITRIGNNAFDTCKSLITVTIPNGVESIGIQAFWHCENMTSISIPDSVTSIGNHAFQSCRKLSEINLPSNITSIGYYAFFDCIALESIIIPRGVETIENKTFYDCYSLSVVTIPDTVTNISQYAFYNCDSLTSITIPKSVTSIGGHAFYNCNSLTSITIPSSVTCIGDYAFLYSDAVVIYGELGSYAETYANENDIPFVATDLSAIATYSLRTASVNTADETATDTVALTHTASFDHAVVGTDYVIAVVEDKNADDLFGSDNLLWIDQCTAESETITFTYTPKYESDTATVLIIGQCNHEISSGIASEATCSAEGVTLYSCAYCNDTYEEPIDMTEHDFSLEWTVETYPTSTIDGSRYRVCAECGEYSESSNVPCLQFAGTTLELQDNLAMNYMVSAEYFAVYEYAEPYVVFETNGIEIFVSDYTVSGEYYVFTLNDILPNQMNDAITATLYATFYDREISSEPWEYSVSEYLYTLLEDCSAEENTALGTLVVDLLNYGAASQVYTGYNTDNLVNSALTDEQIAFGTSTAPELTTVLNAEYETVENPTVTWKSVGLNLEESFTIRVKLAADSIDNLTVVATGFFGEKTIDSSDFVVTNGGYYVFVDGINATQMSEPIYLTVYDGETAVSNTLCYSVESYAYSKQNSTDENLIALVNAMMNYGNAAVAYAQ